MVGLKHRPDSYQEVTASGIWVGSKFLTKCSHLSRQLVRHGIVSCTISDDLLLEIVLLSSLGA